MDIRTRWELSNGCCARPAQVMWRWMANKTHDGTVNSSPGNRIDENHHCGVASMTKNSEERNIPLFLKYLERTLGRVAESFKLPDAEDAYAAMECANKAVNTIYVSERGSGGGKGGIPVFRSTDSAGRALARLAGHLGDGRTLLFTEESGITAGVFSSLDEVIDRLENFKGERTIDLVRLDGSAGITVNRYRSGRAFSAKDNWEVVAWKLKSDSVEYIQL
ncbi:hypothetical protein FCH28_17695 [Streptomyces piniterrae]|uniref:Uncharacterized protein n=1 Tax=Streptomyces piniterrae TaxID=2571125 RepID=A0A4U0NGC3_9ACTN|nr:hypothetical protein [Streptomyces piniterrae]TJZ52993.1 hypothetical protein FCH28_17695 [Streptomyces piniterrae]